MMIRKYHLIMIVEMLLLVRGETPDKTTTTGNYTLDYFSNAKTPSNAKATCESRNAWLIEIKDEEIGKAIVPWLTHDVLIGGKYDNGIWKWNDGSLMRYTKWANGAPYSDPSRKCLMIKHTNYLWKNDNCGVNKVRYICQSDRSYPGGFQITVVKTSATFADAKTYCSNNGSRLVEIKTSALDLFINNMINGDIASYWTSGQYVGGSWKWGDGNSISTSYSNWASPEPIGTNNFCLMKAQSIWKSAKCSEKNGYICQKNACEDEVCSNRGNCSIVNQRYKCSCNAGYFGTKCEKNMISISTATKSYNIKRGQTIKITFKILSYDGNVEVKDINRDKVVKSTSGITSSSLTDSFDFTLGPFIITRSSIDYVFEATSENSESTSLTLNINVKDHCDSNPCENGASCDYLTSIPYFTCTCLPAYKGNTCDVPGVPILFENIVEECSSNITISWTPALEAIGIQHRIDVIKFGMNSTTIYLEIITPNTPYKRVKKITNLEYWTSYNISITICPEMCRYPSTTTKSITTHAGIPGPVSIANVTQSNKTCVIRWSMHSITGITGFTVKAVSTLLHYDSESYTGNKFFEERKVVTNTRYLDFEYTFNRNYTFSIQAQTCAGSGPSLDVTGNCVTNTGPPEIVPRPIIATESNEDDTVNIIIPFPDEISGLISCVFVILVYKPNQTLEQKITNQKDLETAMLKSESKSLKANDAYIAIAISRLDLHEVMRTNRSFSRKLGDGSSSTCDLNKVSNLARKKRETTPMKTIKATNSQLENDANYSYYVLTTTPSDGGELYYMTSNIYYFTKTIYSTSFQEFSQRPQCSTLAIIFVSIYGLLSTCINVILFVRNRKKTDGKTKTELSPSGAMSYSGEDKIESPYSYDNDESDNNIFQTSSLESPANEEHQNGSHPTNNKGQDSLYETVKPNTVENDKEKEFRAYEDIN